MIYSYQTVYTDSEFLTVEGYGKVANIPCIFDSRPGFHRLGSLYLIERALGVWSNRDKITKNKLVIPSRQSMKNYADWLCNFLEWCEVREIDYLSLDYSRDLIGGYQREMLEGSWSRDNRSLSERTINVRVDTAGDFIGWSTEKGLCVALSIPKRATDRKIYNAASESYQVVRAETRGGKLREGKRYIFFPAECELARWRKRILERLVRGETEVLIVDLITETAIRLEEAACWRVDTLPRNPKDWRIVNPQAIEADQVLLVDIRYGTKGHEYGRNHGDKIGPIGTIRLPLLLAKRLHNYSEYRRPLALAVAIKEGNTRRKQLQIREQAVHLFLSPTTGKRYTSDNIYEVWRFGDPPKGWSPHRARDYWACSVLWERIEQQRILIKEALEKGCDQSIRRALLGNMLSVIQLEIQPQLRHSSHETTMLYLQWAADRIGISLNLHEKWSAELGESDDFAEI